jgi:hypothetical protein
MKRSVLAMAMLAAVFSSLLLTIGATSDLRTEKLPVARIECAQLDWVTDEGHAAQTTTADLNGIVYRIDIIISSVTAEGVTVDVSYEDQNGVVCLPAMSTLAENTKHFKNALVNSLVSSADFDPVAIAGTVTVTVDPSADAGGSAQTLTVDVIFFVR